MVLFNYSTKELTAKVVYYGPGLCGKTTNLQWIHEKLPIKNKGKMLSLATETDRTLFFDFLPIEIGAIRGMRTRIQLYTVPGQVFYNATRRMVLKGADAVVFVCDSQEPMLEANLDSYENLRQNLEANEIDPDEIPIVMQYNKRDLPNALPIEILNERLNPRNFPFYEAVAPKGIGVEDTLKAVTKLVFRSLSARYGEAGASSSGRGSPPPRSGSAPDLLPQSPLPDSSGELLGGFGLTPGPPVLTPPPSSTPSPASVPPRVPAPPRAAVVSAPASSAATNPRAPAELSLSPSSEETPSFETVVRPTEDLTLPTPVLHQDPPPLSSLRAHSPQSTLVSSASEADELRRRISAPGASHVEELDLEEIEDLDAPLPQMLAPDTGPAPPRLPAPEPLAPAPPRFAAPQPPVPERAGSAEVEVPIEIHVAPGTTRINLRLKLVINLKPRR